MIINTKKSNKNISEIKSGNHKKQRNKKKMCGTCECGDAGKPVQYKCGCGCECTSPIIEFDEEPKSTPHCCGVPMKRIK